MYKRLNATGTLIQRNTADSEKHQGGSSVDTVDYIGLDVPKKTISYEVGPHSSPSEYHSKAEKDVPGSAPKRRKGTVPRAPQIEVAKL